jgi:hypothetical protein
MNFLKNNWKLLVGGAIGTGVYFTIIRPIVKTKLEIE